MLLWLLEGARARGRLISSRFNSVCPEGLHQSIAGASLLKWPIRLADNLPDSTFPRAE